MSNNTSRGNPACPYLGLEDDADTSLAFPSIWNTCHRSRRVVSPSLEHQSEYCLCENHRNCVALASGRQVTLPQHLRSSRNHATRPQRNPYQGFAFLFIGFVVLISLGWGFWSQGFFSLAVTEIPSAIVTVWKTPVPSDTATPAPVSTITITVVPEPVLTGGALPKRELDSPIGSDYKFVIHRILNGENLNQYASKYNTSVDAILMVNYDLKTPVWVDELVIIPVGFTNVYGLPAFEAYEVPRTDMSLNVLALSFGVSLKDLRYYNAIGMDESLQIGDWVLIPHPKQKS